MGDSKSQWEAPAINSSRHNACSAVPQGAATASALQRDGGARSSSASVRSRPAAANPWGGNSLEWHTPSPPPHHNFDVDPVADDPYDYSKWTWDSSQRGYVHQSRA